MDKDKERLLALLHSQFQSINRQVLNISEMLVPGDKWATFRSRILDITNNVRRELEAEITKSYTIDYHPGEIYEDVVKVNSGRLDSVSYKKGEEKRYGNQRKGYEQE